MSEEEIEKQEELVSSLEILWKSMDIEEDKMWKAWNKKHKDASQMGEKWLVEFIKLDKMKENTNEKAK